jgi:hypothetical protein
VSHEVHTVFEKGWSQLKNGDLLATAILHGYEVLVSTDQNLRHQHDLRNLRLGIVVLMTTSWPQIRNNTPAVATAIVEVKTGGLVEVPFDVQ